MVTLVLAIYLTAGTFFFWDDRPSILGIEGGVSREQAMQLAIVQVVPGVWILVLVAGIGAAFSFMDN